MSKTISVHSYRGGTGKSNTTANLATLLAMEGAKVGVVDTDIQSPGIHVPLKLDESEMGHTLNDYLWGKCTIGEAAHNVTAKIGDNIKGKVWLIPSSPKAGEIARILREGYDVGLLNDGFRDLLEQDTRDKDKEAMNLDYLLIDTHPGLNEETLLSIAISDVLILILRPDKQDFQGTAVTADVARKLEVPKMFLLINKTPPNADLDKLYNDVLEKYDNTPIAAILLHSDEMMELASAGVFVVSYPNHPITQKLKDLMEKVK